VIVLYTDYIILFRFMMIESKPRKFLLVVPPDLPHPLISTIFSAVFQGGYICVGAILMSSPTLATIGAGLRSALVIDIGWRETTVSGIFELREVRHSRSDRAARWLGKEVCQLLATEVKRDRGELVEGEAEDPENTVSFEETEEVLERIVWCKSYAQAHQQSKSTKTGNMDEEEFTEDNGRDSPKNPIIPILLASTDPPTSIQLALSRLSDPVESSLFSYGLEGELGVEGETQDAGRFGHPDDNELPIHILAYRCLLSLPKDVRASCMSRIVITGGVSRIPGLKKRLLDEVAAIVEHRGWDPVRGRAADTTRRLKKLNNTRQSSDGPVEVRQNSNPTDTASPSADSAASPAFAEPERDQIEEKLRREDALYSKALMHGNVRGVESLGAWVGGSLVSNLKVKGVVEVEREKFLMHGGLAGASKEHEVSMNVPQRAVSGTAVARNSTRDSWTLGSFA
jgi:Actin